MLSGKRFGRTVCRTSARARLGASGRHATILAVGGRLALRAAHPRRITPGEASQSVAPQFEILRGGKVVQHYLHYAYPRR